jgi:hypothetical protein
MNFAQSIAKFIQTVLNDSFKTLFNAFNININPLLLNSNQILIISNFTSTPTPFPLHGVEFQWTPWEWS